MAMKLPRRYRILTALIALFSMLFMQAAAASYACPALHGPGNNESTVGEAASMAAMPDCNEPDPTQPALCHAHCLDGKTSLDKPEAPTVSPAAFIVSAILVQAQPVLAATLPASKQPSFLHRSTAPPIAIRHCCFRI